MFRPVLAGIVVLAALALLVPDRLRGADEADVARHREDDHDDLGGLDGAARCGPLRAEPVAGRRADLAAEDADEPHADRAATERPVLRVGRRVRRAWEQGGHQPADGHHRRRPGRTFDAGRAARHGRHRIEGVAGVGRVERQHRHPGLPGADVRRRAVLDRADLGRRDRAAALEHVLVRGPRPGPRATTTRPFSAPVSATTLASTDVTPPSAPRDLLRDRQLVRRGRAAVDAVDRRPGPAERDPLPDLHQRHRRPAG